jgi:hypothetical protein
MNKIHRYTTGHFITLDAYLNSRVSRGEKIFLAVCAGYTISDIIAMIIKYIPGLLS